MTDKTMENIKRARALAQIDVEQVEKEARNAIRYDNMYQRLMRIFFKGAPNRGNGSLMDFCKVNDLNYSNVKGWHNGNKSSPTLKKFIEVLDKCDLTLHIIPKKDLFR